MSTVIPRPVNDERAPLLPPPDSAYSSRSRSRPKHKRALSILTTIAIATLSILLGLALFLILFAASFKPSDIEIEALQRDAFSFSAKPESISVISIDQSGVLLNLTVLCGIDADKALGVGLSEQEIATAAAKGYRGAGAEWWEGMRLRAARWGAGYVPSVKVTPGLVRIAPRNGSPLAEATISTLNVPFIPGASASGTMVDWLQPMHLTVLAKPIGATGDIWDFLQQGWAAGKVDVVVTAENVSARVPGKGWWREMTQVFKENVVMEISAPIAHLPGLPLPGRPFDLARLVRLEEYHLTTKHDALQIHARAVLPNPYPLNYTMPLSLPFAVSYNGNRMAEVVTQPINLSSHSIQLFMSGQVLKIKSDVSAFLQNYLHGLDNPIVVDGMSRLAGTPSWILDLLSTISVPLLFPGPRPPPQVIHSVTIERMRISESAGKMRASGLVIAQIDLPAGMKVKVDVQGVLPDVIIYDGPVSEGRAFGHIRPDSFLNSTTAPSDDPFNPDRLVVRAPIEGVPVDILPGKDRILSDFVSKIVFKGGALAGINGNASVEAAIIGIDTVRLNDLPVRGETWVGR